MNKKEYSVDFGGKKLFVEISDLADQADGSVLVRYGETTVFATAVMSKNVREGLDFFPLSVDYEEKFYAAGQILGSRFLRREGRPSEEAILTSRAIDRTIRPLFNKKIRNEVQVVVLALSVDKKNDPDIPAIIAASLALGISDIPWGGPIGAVRVCHIGGKYVINPTREKEEEVGLELLACGRDGKINMIEAEGAQAKEDIAVAAMKEAVVEIEKIQKFQEDIIKEIGKKKRSVEIKPDPEGMEELFNEKIFSRMKEIIYGGEMGDLNVLKKEWFSEVEENIGEGNNLSADDFFEEKINDIIHEEIINNERRPDGRRLDEVRPISAEVGVLPVVHGSGVFYRGGTHVLSVVTLGGAKDAQLIEGMQVQATRRFMHHYNFPPFSTGETGRMSGTGRREIGHGALAEKALSAVIPSQDEFPYTIRIVSESMASNGSTSQGSICASTLALMDTGVPIKNPVAGIAVGLMLKDDKNYKIVTDIQGPEDHHGDMDFKVSGTKEGITAIQMDVKVGGITIEILEKALEQGKKAREEILKEMLKVIPGPRAELSPTAPRIVKIMIDPSKIGTVVGPGGKTINGIIEKTGVDINIEQDGSVFILGKDKDAMESAKKMVEGLVHEFKEGEEVEGPVSRIFDFGAMIQIGPNQEGMVHISELAPFRVNKVTDIVNLGDTVKAKVINIDEKGRVNLSIKRLDPNCKVPKNDGRTGYRGRRTGERGAGR